MSGVEYRAAGREPAVRAAALTAAELLTPAQVAARWQVSTDFVYRLAREGKVPHVRLGDKHIRFRADALDAWETAGGLDNPPAAA